MTPDIEITDLSRVTISCVCWVFCFKVNIAKDIKMTSEEITSAPILPVIETNIPVEEKVLGSEDTMMKCDIAGGNTAVFISNTSFPNNLQISQNHVKNKNESPRIGRKGKRKLDSGQGTSTAKKSKR